MGVGPDDAVVVADDGGIAIGHKGSNPRSSRQIPLKSSDEIVVRWRCSQSSGFHFQKTNIECSRLSVYSRSTDNGHRQPRSVQSDSPAEKGNQVAARSKTERAGIFEKKIALLGKEEIEAREID